MTEQQAINKVVEKANSQVGYREGTNNYNKYASALDPLKITYGNKQYQPWCGEFKLWVFVDCFGVNNALKMLYSPNPTGIPLCSAGAGYFKSAGRWSSKPQVGACVFFNVSGGINHTGIVTGVSSLSITTVEGNSSDMVARRVYPTSDIGGKIAGFGIPDWAVVAEEIVVDTPSVNKAGDLPLLRKGDKGEVVRAAQMLLNGRDCSVGRYGCDGDFGAQTYAAVLAFQRRNGLDADGEIGEHTWAALLGVT